MEENSDSLRSIKQGEYVVRPSVLDISSIEIETFVGDLVKIIESFLIEQHNPYDFMNYFNDGNYDAAIIFAFKELELKIRELAQEKNLENLRIFNLYNEFLPPDYSNMWLDFKSVRNE